MNCCSFSLSCRNQLTDLPLPLLKAELCGRGEEVWNHCTWENILVSDAWIIGCFWTGAMLSHWLFAGFTLSGHIPGFAKSKETLMPRSGSSMQQHSSRYVECYVLFWVTWYTWPVLIIEGSMDTQVIFDIAQALNATLVLQFLFSDI